MSLRVITSLQEDLWNTSIRYRISMQRGEKYAYADNISGRPWTHTFLGETLFLPDYSRRVSFNAVLYKSMVMISNLFDIYWKEYFHRDHGTVVRDSSITVHDFFRSEYFYFQERPWTFSTVSHQSTELFKCCVFNPCRSWGQNPETSKNPEYNE